MKRLLLATTVLVCVLADLAPAQTPTPIRMRRIEATLTRAVDIVAAPNDPLHLYVVEQNAADIHVLTYDPVADDYDLEPGTFLDLTGLVQTGGNEQGLLSMTFHPDYDGVTNKFFYLYYTKSGSNNNDSVVARYETLSPLAADAGSGTTIIGPIDQPQTNHNGGKVFFGPDGKLYVGTGDGGNFNDTGPGHVSGGNAQSGVNLLGKLLRYNDDGTIPADNPFVGNANFQNPIFHYGLRNPWRSSFDRETGDLWIGDVGQFDWEEIDYLPAGTPGGVNFGWRCMEGFNCTGLSGCTCNAPNLTLPVVEYSLGGSPCATVGGYVYRGDAIPDLDGTYFYSDHCSRQFFSLANPTASPVNRTAELTNGGAVSTDGNIVTFGEDANGEMYVGSDGSVFKIVPATQFIGLGSADAGVAGDPILWGVGDLTSGSSGEINLRRAAPSSTAVLFVSLTEGAVPFKGGTLVAFPVAISITLSTNAQGERFLPFTWPAGVPAGSELFFQYAIQDAAASGGVSLSNAIKGTAQ